MIIAIKEDVLTPDLIDTEDSGMAKIGSIYSPGEDEDPIFVRVQSWDETKRHETFNRLVGKRVRVTVEVLD